MGAPVQSKSGGTDPFCGRAPPLFGSKSTISRFDERFRDGQYSLVSFLFAVLLLTVPPCSQAFVKVGARAPNAPWSRRHWLGARTVRLKLHDHTLMEEDDKLVMGFFFGPPAKHT